MSSRLVGEGAVHRRLLVHISTMADLHNYYDAALVVDRVKDTVISLPNTILHVASKLFTSCGTGIGGKLSDLSNDPPAIFERESFEFLGGSSFDLDAITCHASSGS